VMVGRALNFEPTLPIAAPTLTNSRLAGASGY
jgi:hypothetical protein